MRPYRLLAAACSLALATGCSSVTGAGAPATSTAPVAPVTSSSARSGVVNPDPAKFAPQVIARAHEVGVDPQLVLAILYNENYKPHDPQLERAWQNLKPDAAFGVANMHRGTFDQTRRGRPFATRQWQDLPDDPDLAIQAEAWYLHDLAAQLPAKHIGQYTADELLALGYNTGPGNMKAFARGTKPGAQARTYLADLRANWAKAGVAVGKPYRSAQPRAASNAVRASFSPA
ncbi:transglycosylase SLT domain-containing protein [Amycolatopsis nalaikhensis]|uniref:Transglycosylase SLT domain-containing protein n=1 Tax=Amycolatopsis nalaikhensis TaxID=715472 RepID=A0ABY8XUV6_9PSEU|nr:transglycosylase SLT domain-containing protein [Amycolatopsis sp. 2-2]WIV59215.1 transglycosylase SLT domain-containing protein [Amycolatopsis sp. 2-2]